MFNLGMLEIVLVLVVAFLVVGPKDLPKVARWIARQLKSLKKLIREIKKETGWDEFAKEFRDTAEDLKATVKEADVREEIKSAADELRGATEDIRTAVEEVRDDVNAAGKELKDKMEA